ncbi:MAG: metalloregulator ArsR/SmtB family transcription factor [Zoogloeaceae bacterium]|nr:metalloregulator ArsR/SmtB family transcription factor [Zoogloeaceae bacterium]
MNAMTHGFSPEILRQHAGQACALLKALGNEDRLMLLCALGGSAEGRLNVGQLEEVTGIRQPTLSQQLAVLRQEGIVVTEKEGKYVFYRMADPKASAVMETLFRLFCAADCPAATV